MFLSTISFLNMTLPVESIGNQADQKESGFPDNQGLFPVYTYEMYRYA